MTHERRRCVMHVIASLQSSKALAYALPLHLPCIRTLGLSIGFPCKIDPGCNPDEAISSPPKSNHRLQELCSHEKSSQVFIVAAVTIEPTFDPYPPPVCHRHLRRFSLLPPNS